MGVPRPQPPSPAGFTTGQHPGLARPPLPPLPAPPPRAWVDQTPPPVQGSPGAFFFGAQGAAARGQRFQSPRQPPARLAGEAARTPVLALTQRLLLSLPRQSVVPLARDLHAVARARWWLTDLASPILLKMLEKRWSPSGQQENAPFVFGPAEGSAFFKPHGWNEIEWHSSFAESLRIKRTLRGGATFWKIMDKLQTRSRREKGRRMSGILLMNNIDDPGATKP